MMVKSFQGGDVRLKSMSATTVTSRLTTVTPSWPVLHHRSRVPQGKRADVLLGQFGPRSSPAARIPDEPGDRDGQSRLSGWNHQNADGVSNVSGSGTRSVRRGTSPQGPGLWPVHRSPRVAITLSVRRRTAVRSPSPG
jgi:hypothetical protein